ncbi:MAG: MFS transporter [Alphaproteobacteria bacterium]|nr:MFS transporter [Alphaproteobacteria bacterium]
MQYTALKQKFGRGINVPLDELIPALFMCVASFFKSLGTSLFTVGAMVLYLQKTNAENLYSVLIITGFCIMALCPLIIWMKSKSTKFPVYAMFVVLLIGALICGLVKISPNKMTFTILAAWAECMRVGIEAGFLILACRFGLFKDRPKNLTASVISANLGILVAGLLIRIGHTDSPTVWIYVAFSVLLPLVLCSALVVSSGYAPISEKLLFFKKDMKWKGLDRRQLKLMKIFLASSFLMFVCSGLFQYYFVKSSVFISGGFTSKVDTVILTDIFSTVFIVVGLLSFLFAFGVLLRKIGFFPLLYVLPVAILVTYIASYLRYTNIDPNYDVGSFKLFSLFGLVALCRGAYLTVAGNKKEIIYMIVPNVVSTRAFFRAVMLRKGIVEPLGLIVAGLVIYLFEIGQLNYINFLNALLVSSALFFICLFALKRRYIVLVLSNLRTRLWRAGRLIITGKKTRNFINGLLDSINPNDAIYGLRVVEDSLHPGFFLELRKAMFHVAREVRLYAIEKIENLSFRSALGEIRYLVNNEQDPVVRSAAIRALCKLGNRDDRIMAKNFFTNPSLCEGALSGLLSVGQEGIFETINTIASMISHPDANVRCMAAKVLGDAQNKVYYQPLIGLLNDSNELVSLQAIHASEKLLCPELLPALMNVFRFPNLREDALNTLIKYGDEVLPAVEWVWRKTQFPHQLKSMLARMLRNIDTPECKTFLLDHINIKDSRIRYDIIKSLFVLKYKAKGKDCTNIRLCLYDEIEFITIILSALDKLINNDDLNSKAEGRALCNALQTEINYTKERILLLLALIHPNDEIDDLLNKYAYLSEDERLNISKSIDENLTGELHQLCMPIFQPISVIEKLNALRLSFYPPILPIKEHIVRIIQSNSYNTWTVACAIYMLAKIGDKSDLDLLIPHMTNDDPIVRETVVYTIGKLFDVDKATCLLMPFMEDNSAAVRRMIHFVTDGISQPLF